MIFGQENSLINSVRKVMLPYSPLYLFKKISVIVLLYSSLFSGHSLAAPDRNYVNQYIRIEKMSLDLLGKHFLAIEGLGRSLRHTRIERLRKLVSRPLPLSLSSDSFVYFYDYRGVFLFGSKHNLQFPSGYFEVLARRVVEGGALPSPVLVNNEKYCFCQVFLVNQDLYRQGFVVVGRSMDGIIEGLRSSAGGGEAVFQIGSKKSQVDAQKQKSNGVASIKVPFETGEIIYSPSSGFGFSKLSFGGLGIVAAFLVFLAALAYILYFKTKFTRELEHSLTAIIEGKSLKYLPKRFSLILQMINKLKLDLGKSERLAKYNQDQLAQIGELSRVKGWELAVYLNQIGNVLAEHEKLSKSVEAAKDVNLDEVLGSMIQHASIVINYSRLYGLHRVARVGSKIRDKLTVFRNAGVRITSENIQEIDEHYFDIMFLLDSYVTLRELKLGDIVTNASGLFLNPLQSEYIRTLLLPGVLPGDVNQGLIQSLHFLFQENLDDHIPDYNDVIRKAADEESKQINDVVFPTSLLLFDRDDWIYLNEIILHSLLFLVRMGLEAPGRRRQSGRSDAGLIELKMDAFDGEKYLMRFEIDGNNMNLDELLASAYRGGSLVSSQVADLNYREKWCLLARTSGCLANKVTREDHLTIVSDLVKTLGGEISLDVGSSNIILNVSWPSVQYGLKVASDETVAILVSSHLYSRVAVFVEEVSQEFNCKMWPVGHIEEFKSYMSGNPAIIVADREVISFSRDIQEVTGSRLIKVLVTDGLSDAENLVFQRLKGDIKAVSEDNLTELLTITLQHRKKKGEGLAG